MENELISYANEVADYAVMCWLDGDSEKVALNKAKKYYQGCFYNCNLKLVYSLAAMNLHYEVLRQKGNHIRYLNLQEREDND